MALMDPCNRGVDATLSSRQIDSHLCWDQRWLPGQVSMSSSKQVNSEAATSQPEAFRLQSWQVRAIFVREGTSESLPLPGAETRTCFIPLPISCVPELHWFFPFNGFQIYLLFICKPLIVWILYVFFFWPRLGNSLLNALYFSLISRIPCRQTYLHKT